MSEKCEHKERNGEWSFVLTGNVIDGLNEYVCKFCALIHLASKEEESLNTFFLQPLRPQRIAEIDKRQYIENAIGIIFGEKAEVYHRLIRRAGGSAQLNVPKRFAFTPATIIVWTKEKDPVRYGQTGTGRAKTRQGPFPFHPVYGDPNYKTRGELEKELKLVKDELQKLDPNNALVKPHVQETQTETKTSSDAKESTDTRPGLPPTELPPGESNK